MTDPSEARPANWNVTLIYIISVGKHTIQEYSFEQNWQNASQKAQTLDKTVHIVLNTLGKYDENVRK